MQIGLQHPAVFRGDHNLAEVRVAIRIAQLRGPKPDPPYGSLVVALEHIARADQFQFGCLDGELVQQRLFQGNLNCFVRVHLQLLFVQRRGVAGDRFEQPEGTFDRKLFPRPELDFGGFQTRVGVIINDVPDDRLRLPTDFSERIWTTLSFDSSPT